MWALGGSVFLYHMQMTIFTLLGVARSFRLSGLNKSIGHLAGDIHGLEGVEIQKSLDFLFAKQ